MKSNQKHAVLVGLFVITIIVLVFASGFNAPVRADGDARTFGDVMDERK